MENSGRSFFVVRLSSQWTAHTTNALCTLCNFAGALTFLLLWSSLCPFFCRPKFWIIIFMIVPETNRPNTNIISEFQGQTNIRHIYILDWCPWLYFFNLNCAIWAYYSCICRKMLPWRQTSTRILLKIKTLTISTKSK